MRHKLLITGGSGFIGRSLKKWFSQYGFWTILTPSHEEMDLLNRDSIRAYITNHNPLCVIHAARTYARWYKRDDLEAVYKNLAMFENLVVECRNCQKLICIGSGAEFDINRNIWKARENDIYNHVSTEYGGFLKGIIAKRIRTIDRPKCYNARVFGCFGIEEDDDRFIKGNLINLLDNKPVVLHKNLWFDYIYIGDLAYVIHMMLTNSSIPNDINCVYYQKRTLADIARIMLHVANKPLDMIEDRLYHKDTGNDYTGDGELLNQWIQTNYMIGLEDGIREMYKQLKDNK